ncbi:bifunctional adenosylcobinamide kinase/adenosylcobinamide-phosphate guanylyltransferase [Cognaticolwellia beringensis]|uniref:Bifunctional adenosylcobalamin biosynthesis protein n=1 Tax=Cognaticolwellia beringensis TaxID=1967665 RepID=A0A222GA66_9GAMM|nr:bifunctional adenosylcobinamide kinase/adenosylcobinamide-phosphate guanylyltransferase [Cognaticolwellia beringensis]ASP48786.1 bifunctional adenosylcobinamide kinase/adenosylcobinamide-phosphate guanylyltransferase [Cognaticolwellia beringensis]
MSPITLNKVQLIIGGARSGKSSLAEQYAKLSNLPVTYIATAQAFDTEMQQRIAQHQAERPEHWSLVESPFLLAKAIESAIASSASTSGICILVDCLTLWLSNSLCKPSVDNDSIVDGNLNFCNLDYWQQEKAQLLTVLERIQLQKNTQTSASFERRVEIILVSNEVGHGIVPMGELSRQFVDQAGWLHQAIAKIADNVEFVMAGLPLTLKSSENTNAKVPS